MRAMEYSGQKDILQRDMSAATAALRKALNTQSAGAPDFAVAVPMIFGKDGVSLLVEVRAQGISQAGDPCFPGGRIEAGEKPLDAAARELREELGLHIPKERFLGRLPTVQTYLGARSAVFVCAASEDALPELLLNPQEVAVLLRPSLDFFLRKGKAGSYTVDGHVIWGMTAGAICHLLDAWSKAAETAFRERKGK